MTEYFFIMLAQVLTLFLLMSIGYLLGKMKMLSKHGREEMSALLMYVVMPCVIVRSMQTAWNSSMLRTIGVGTLALVPCCGIYILISNLFFRHIGKDRQAPLRFGSVYGNTGFMGIPLIQATLGKDALIYAVVSLVVFTVLSWTHGVIQVGGMAAFSMKKLVLNPGVIAVLAGLPGFLFQLQPPALIDQAMSFVGDLNTPLAMVVIGAQMAEVRVIDMFQDKQLYIASMIKLLIVPGVTALVLLPLRLDPVFFAATVILAGTPAAGLTSMFAEAFGKNTAQAAQLVSFSTLLCAITLPFLSVLVQVFA